jgi:hypothetical protein
MDNLRKGLIATSLSMALFVGGAAIGAAAQAASHEHPSATQSSPAAVPENPNSPSATPQSSPAATMPDQDNGIRTVPNKDDRAMPQGDRDRDAKAQDRDRDRDAMSASGKDHNDLTKQEIKTWDSFLDSHPGIAQDLQKDPQKVNDPGWISRHPELESFLADHPKVREELKENPSKVMNREKGFERSEDKK